MAAYDAYDGRRYYPDGYDRSGQNRYGDNNAWLRGSSRDLVMRTYEDGSEVSIEEIERDFPPPGFRHSTSRSTALPRHRSHPDHGYYILGGHPPRRHGTSHYGDDRHSHKHAPAARSQGVTSRKMKTEEQILAAVTGAALAIGGKELMDRREAKQEGGEVRRNMVASAAIGAAGALVGYQGSEAWNKHAEKKARKKARHVLYYGRDGDYSSDSYFSDSDGPYHKKKASFLQNALSAAGLGSAVKAVTGKSSNARSRRGSPGSSRERNETTSKLQKAAMASLIAGATEAFRLSNEPGSWEGEKSKRVLTAAVGAAALDATQGQSKSGKMALAESVIGGLVGNRMLNGSRHNIDEDPKTGRSRSRSRAASAARSRSGSGGMTGLTALTMTGLGALGAKKAANAVASSRAASRSRSRPRSIIRRRRDSYDSRSHSRGQSYSPARNKRSRSRSVLDTARRSLAKMGLITSSEDDRVPSPRSRRHCSDDYDDDDDCYSRSPPNYGRSRPRARSVVSARSAHSEEDERRVHNLKGKQLLSTGLAAVAGIRAIHSTLENVEESRARHHAVRHGQLDPGEARKMKAKAMLKDLASAGLAVVSLKGVLNNIKEAKGATEKARVAKREKREHDERRRAVALHKKHPTREDQRVMRGDEEGTRRELRRLEDLEEGRVSREGSRQSRPHDRLPSQSRPRSPSRRSARSARVEDDVDDDAKHSATDHGVPQQRPLVRYADGNPYGVASSS